MKPPTLDYSSGRKASASTPVAGWNAFGLMAAVFAVPSLALALIAISTGFLILGLLALPCAPVAFVASVIGLTTSRGRSLLSWIGLVVVLGESYYFLILFQSLHS